MLTTLPYDMSWLIYSGDDDYLQREEFEKVLLEDNQNYPPIHSEIIINRSFIEPFDDDIPF